jgi:hypothetical protein
MSFGHNFANDSKSILAVMADASAAGRYARRSASCRSSARRRTTGNPAAPRSGSGARLSCVGGAFRPNSAWPPIVRASPNPGQQRSFRFRRVLPRHRPAEVGDSRALPTGSVTSVTATRTTLERHILDLCAILSRLLISCLARLAGPARTGREILTRNAAGRHTQCG